MEKAKVYLFTSPTCPNCPPAKAFINRFKQTRDDFVLWELSTATSQGQTKARKYGVRSVPTFIIQGPGYASPIGLIGVQSEKSMNKYLDLSFGIEPEQEEKTSFKQKIKTLFGASQ